MARRQTLVLAGVVAAVASAGQAADMAPPLSVAMASGGWAATFASEARWFSWSGTRGTPTTVAANGGAGTQLYVPAALQLVGLPGDDLKVELLARGGWVTARQSTVGLAGEVATPTDTVASGTFT
ncbi:hypothetical protein PQJ75_19915 [Rhodoplanes sp. TEM]|uniref:hypothetical protein n=1 Tax=Rhodoplanes tepidamans TaxID=200616 RepID=UPI00256BF3C9|nr:hypothetical protein [Rhodoplanes tepidamans]MDC7986001.1 hypothetical protein [Rhodoplanes sp. TEM]